MRPDDSLPRPAVAVAASTFALRHRGAHIHYLLWLIVLAKCLIGNTALSLAKEYGHEEIAEMLRKHGAKE